MFSNHVLWRPSWFCHWWTGHRLNICSQGIHRAIERKEVRGPRSVVLTINVATKTSDQYIHRVISQLMNTGKTIAQSLPDSHRWVHTYPHLLTCEAVTFWLTFSFKDDLCIEFTYLQLTKIEKT
jgi:hypothetical protein